MRARVAAQDLVASTASASPALRASPRPYSAVSVGRPRRRSLPSTMSSWTRKALCSSSIATATGRMSASLPPNARLVATHIAGRSDFPGRLGYARATR